MTLLPSKLPWTGKIDGNDIVITNVTATCFGGRWDKGDNGQTESGVLNNGSTALLQIALPIRSTERSTANSPLANPKKPHIPWLSKVMIWPANQPESTAKEAELTDNGPDVEEYPDHAMDFNPALVAAFYPSVDMKTVANVWSAPHGFSCRIIGGAAYV